MRRRRISQIALEDLVAMGTGVSIDIIAKLGTTTRTFYRKHDSTKSMRSAASNLKRVTYGGQELADSSRFTTPSSVRRSRANRPT